MTIASNTITAFYSNPVTFFTSSNGTAMVEVFNVNRFKHESHNVMDLASEILAHKRMMSRIRIASAKKAAA